uniref:Coiled-coil domain containing 106 n=1 Tax=Nothobranchius furzeri TaxID=105023 RepID=A0A1A8V9A1_NOTFU
MDPSTSRHEASTPEHYIPQSSSAAATEGGGGVYLDAYEGSFPLEERAEHPTSYHINQNQQMIEEPVVQEPPHPQYSHFILVSNLRAHLYVSLEKNAWLQKRIEELEEERNFLRCQLDRFIISMRGPDVNEWCGDVQRVKVQPASSPSPPSPMTTRSGMTLKRIQGSGPRSRRSIAVPVKQEFHVEEDYTEDEYVEEEEEEEEEVKKGKIHGVDRNTMASTSPIAELLLVAPEKVTDVGEFEASKEKLLDYARRCYKTMDDETHVKVQNLKKTHKLLPISYRFRN